VGAGLEAVGAVSRKVGTALKSLSECLNASYHIFFI